MTTTLVIGLDGQGTGLRALDHGKQLATLIGDCELLLVYIIEWSPYSFQTAEENAVRHQRREEEIATANERVIDPALADLKEGGFTARGVVRHGHVADMLNTVCVEEKGTQIIVGRASEGGFAKRLFGGATAHLVMNASVPVTVIS